MEFHVRADSAPSVKRAWAEPKALIAGKCRPYLAIQVNAERGPSGLVQLSSRGIDDQVTHLNPTLARMRIVFDALIFA